MTAPFAAISMLPRRATLDLGQDQYLSHQNRKPDPSLDIQPSTCARIKASGRAERAQRRGVPIPAKTLAIGTAVGLVATDLSDVLATRDEIRIGLSLGDSTHAGPFSAEVRMRAAALVCADDPIASAAIKLRCVRLVSATRTCN